MKPPVPAGVKRGDPSSSQREAGNSSVALDESVADFTFDPGSPTTSASASQTVVPGSPAVYLFNLLPQNGSFTLPVALSATGYPPGATVTFTPQVITIGPSPASFTMTIQTAAVGASLHHNGPFSTTCDKGTIALGLLLLPFSRSLRRKVRGMRVLTLSAIILSFAAIGGLTGCGANNGFFGQPQQDYTINVIATATGVGGATLQRSWTVTLTVQ